MRLAVVTVNWRSGRYVADTDARSVFADTPVEVVVYCSFHNLDRGFIIFIGNLLDSNWHSRKVTYICVRSCVYPLVLHVQYCVTVLATFYAIYVYIYTYVCVCIYICIYNSEVLENWHYRTAHSPC
jgi:hypothetical protein